jgi:penicillin-binding protein 2
MPLVPPDGGERARFSFQGKLRFGFVIVAVILLGLLLRAYYLQVIRGDHYRELSEHNRLALIKHRAPRGIIFDRRHRPLVANQPTFTALLVPEDTSDIPGTTAMLVKNLGIDARWLDETLRRVGRYRRFAPIEIKQNLTSGEVAYLEEMRYQYPGVRTSVDSIRRYNHGSMAAHILGYVGEVTPDDLRRAGETGLEIGSHIGKTGLERLHDANLRGVDGGQQVEVDSLGRRLRVVANQEPLPGQDLALTIDADIQKAAEEALGDVRGTVVVLDPRNGDILAMVSHPAYDPNLFTGGIGADDWNLLARDRRFPLQNRSIQSQYPPGSVFKLVTAAAALEAGVITPESTVTCTGGVELGNRYFRCWKAGGHGTVALNEAIAQSCDSYFYVVGRRLGIDKLARYAREMGLGARTGIPLPGEVAGLVPDTAWKKRARKAPWYTGETLSASIGQGYNLVTPLQAAVMVSAVAVGEVWRPRLVTAVLNPDGSVDESFAPQRVRALDFKPATLEAVRRGMYGVVNAPGGTGGRARLKSVTVAGKTGTAQVVGMRQGEAGRQQNLAEDQRDHAWFAAYAPYGNPQATVVVMVEHAGHGGSTSAPIAQAVLRAIFEPEAEPVVPAEGEEFQDGD